MLPTPTALPPGPGAAHDEARWQQLLSFAGQDPANPSLVAELVDVALQQGRAAEALHWAEQECALPRPEGGSAYRHGVALLLNRRFEDAQVALQAVLAHEGAAAGLGLRLSLAQACAQLQDWVGVVEALSPLYALAAPTQPSPGSDMHLVRALHHLGRLEEAVQVAEQALAARPNPALADALGTLYLDSNRLEDATALYQARAGGPPTAEWQVLGGYVALAEGQLAQAQQRFEASLGGMPNGRAALGLGLSQATAGDLQAAQQSLQRAVSLMPEHLGSWHALAWMQMITGQLDAAQASFEAAMARNHNFGDNYGGLALVAMARGHKDRAGELARTGLRLDANSMNSGLVLTLLRTGQNLDFSDPELAKRGLVLMLSKQIGEDATRGKLLMHLAQAAQRARRA